MDTRSRSFSLKPRIHEPSVLVLPAPATRSNKYYTGACDGGSARVTATTPKKPRYTDAGCPGRRATSALTTRRRHGRSYPGARVRWAALRGSGVFNPLRGPHHPPGKASRSAADLSSMQNRREGQIREPLSLGFRQIRAHFKSLTSIETHSSRKKSFTSQRPAL